MDYSVEKLASAAGIRVGTIRFYQTRGLLPPPARVKRTAVYSDGHLAVLKRIRRYQSQGLTLAVIKRVLSSRHRSPTEALLSAVADESGERSLTRAQLTAQSGVAEALLASLEGAGLLAPVMGDSDSPYGEADVQMARAGLEILSHGFPVSELLALALRHARGVEEVADAAIDLFDRFIRKAGGATADSGNVAEVFQRLLPAVTTLVAIHFQRTLLRRAIDRLRHLEQGDALEAAMAVVESGRLEVTWR